VLLNVVPEIEQPALEVEYVTRPPGFEPPVIDTFCVVDVRDVAPIVIAAWLVCENFTLVAAELVRA
jgi:hypothetical protein